MVRCAETKCYLKVWIVSATCVIGSIDVVYNLVKKGKGPSGNEESSYLTIVSYPGLMFGIINIVGMSTALQFA